MFDTYCIIYFYVINLKDTFSIYLLIYMNVIVLHVNPLLIFVIRFDYNGLRKLQRKLHTIWKIKKSTLTMFSVIFFVCCYFLRKYKIKAISPHSHTGTLTNKFKCIHLCLYEFANSGRRKWNWTELNKYTWNNINTHTLIQFWHSLSNTYSLLNTVCLCAACLLRTLKLFAQTNRVTNWHTHSYSGFSL